MKNIDLGQTLGLLANVGVIAGIVLLAYELHQNRQMMRAQTRNAISETLIGLLTLPTNSPELNQMLQKRAAGEPLTPLERGLYIGYEGAFWRYRENVSYQYRNGLFDESEYLPQREVWIREINTEADTRELYCGQHSSRSAAFTAEIDAFLERPCD